jgi:hypothetical protein
MSEIGTIENEIGVRKKYLKAFENLKKKYCF